MSEKSILHIVEEYDGAKYLPRHDETGTFHNVFEANGQKYYILKEVDAFPMSRWGWFGKYAAQFMAGMDFQNWFQTILAIEDLQDKFVNREVKFAEVAVKTRAARDEVMAMSQMKYATAWYLCSLFIVRPGEDLTTWVLAQADEKIADWQKEGYRSQDFLQLAAHYVGQYNKELTVLMEALANVQETAQVQSQTPDGYTDGTE